jgi:hypothetical protein
MRKVKEVSTDYVQAQRSLRRCRGRPAIIAQTHPIKNARAKTSSRVAAADTSTKWMETSIKVSRLAGAKPTKQSQHRR